MTENLQTAKHQLLQLIDKLSVTHKTLSNTELFSVLNATKSIYDNEHLIDFLIQFIKTSNSSTPKNTNTLTKREKQVVLLIGKGLQNTSIALELDLRKSTVETHRKNIRKKLKLNRTDNLFAFSFIFRLQHQKSQS
ncbi:MAG: LuxR C-terminal-related transcriptional regulator [Psychroserpens sp.]|uniref:response regulator transcription factor n=1 Tax=Psychroserpens sp. TaxID=2020870 RepID=UPI003002D473